MVNVRVGWMVLAWVVCGLTVARGQLAITEVMPVSKINTNTLFHGAEFWELTNFGTNDIDLDGYSFRDDNPPPIVRFVFTNLTIRAGESVIFFRLEPNNTNVVTAEHFKAWWGTSRLPPDLQCRIYEDPGLSAWDGDQLWLMDANGNVVDAVRFDSTQLGFSFTYDPDTGHFDALSESGMGGAFTAALTPDVGSPGTTAGPVPVHFVVGPADIGVDGGMTVTFSATAGGMPPPRYQWYFEDVAISGATDSSFTLVDVQPAHAGAYRVAIANGLTLATSTVARLTVNTHPTAPSVANAPKDASVFIGQTAAFAVSARGYPPPQYQWQINGADIEGAVGPMLELVDVGADMNGAMVSVILSNSVGWTRAAATLTVTRWRDLRFTEVMTHPAAVEGNRVFGWVELTNFDTNTIDLFGWRFAEEDSFARAVTITNPISLAPGESLVIAERLDKVRFARWWGGLALPENFKLYSYRGFGLGTNGGVFYLWNAAARDAQVEYVTGVSWASSTPGVSYECEHWSFGDKWMSEVSVLSSLGVRGAFASADGLDLGSPGYTDCPELQIISIAQEASGRMALACKVIAGKNYRLWRAGSLASPAWDAVETKTASNNLVIFTTDADGASAFFRVEEIP